VTARSGNGQETLAGFDGAKVQSGGGGPDAVRPARTHCEATMRWRAVRAALQEIAAAGTGQCALVSGIAASAERCISRC